MLLLIPLFTYKWHSVTDTVTHTHTHKSYSKKRKPYKTTSVIYCHSLPEASLYVPERAFQCQLDQDRD